MKNLKITKTNDYMKTSDELLPRFFLTFVAGGINLACRIIIITGWGSGSQTVVLC